MTYLSAAPPLLVRDARIAFGDRLVARDLSLDFPAGRTTCLLGRSGVGKTSLLRWLAGLLPQAPRAQPVAYMAQSDLLLPWLSVLDNVLLGYRLRGDRAALAAARKRARGLLAEVGLADRLDDRPAQLSGGMRQRAALARTLCEDRPVVLMDEAFAHLDAVTQLELDGIGLFSSYNGVYLGDPRLDPLMETLDNLGAMVFVHPVTPLQPPQLGLPTFLFEFPFDTTRAGVNLLYRNVFLRFPRIRWLMAHAGGTLPYLSYRTGLLRLNLDPGRSLFSDLYYDTALSSATPSMKALREITSVSHILFATDWPFSGLVYLTKLPGDPARELDDSFNGAERRKVDRDNALAQFPRLAARLARLG